MSNFLNKKPVIDIDKGVDTTNGVCSLLSSPTKRLLFARCCSKRTPNIIFHHIHHSFWRFLFNAFLRKIEGPPYTNGLLKKRDMIWDEYSIYGAFELDRVIFFFIAVWIFVENLRRGLAKIQNSSLCVTEIESKQIMDSVRILTNYGMGWMGTV